MTVKIVRNKAEGKQFGSLYKGEAFLSWADPEYLWMKIEEGDGDDFSNAVALDDGDRGLFEETDSVIPVNITITVEE